MTLFAGETRLEEGADQFVRERGADDASAQHQHVHVVVLDALVRRVGVVTQTGANPGDAIGSHRCADATAADDDAAVGAIVLERGRDGLGAVGVVNRLGAVGADVEHLTRLVGQKGLDRFFELEPGMVRSDRDAHGHLAPAAGSPFRAARNRRRASATCFRAAATT